VASSRFAGPESLRQLLDAVMAIGSDLDLEATLRRIIEVARELVDARYAALGVLNLERTALARRLGGSFTMAPGAQRGTVVEWCVPLAD
jgi:hypothetical protein